MYGLDSNWCLLQMVKLLSVNRVQSSTQLVARRQMKKHLRRVRNKEYCRLRDMVPNIANKQKVSKVSGFLMNLLKKYNSVYFFTLTAKGIMEFWFVKFVENKMILQIFMSAVKFMIRFRIKTPFILLNCYEEITWFSTLTRGIESIRSTCKLAKRLFL